MNMSKVMPAAGSERCTAWQAPHFSQGEAGNLEYNSEPALLTREQQEAMQQRAYDEAFARGYSEGKQQAQQDILQKVQELGGILDAMQAPFDNLDDKIIDEMVELCMAVVKQMVRRELKISPGEIVAVVRESLKLLPVASGDVKLELHPDDAQIVREVLLKSGADADGNEAAHSPGWQIIEDPVISRGGCRVFTSTSRIDATVENRLNAAIAAVMGGERHVD